MRLLPLALALVVAACESPGGDRGSDGGWRANRGLHPEGPTAVLSTSSRSYAPGQPIDVRLTNAMRTPLGYNLCRASLERNLDDDWRQVQATLGEVCTAELRTLNPGQSAGFSFRMNREMRRGQYRIRADLTDVRGGGRVTAVSEGFMLTGNDSD